MDYGTTTPQLIKALRQSFCYISPSPKVYDQMVGSILPQACSISLLNNGDSHTKFQHHIILKVMEKWKLL